MYTPLYIKTDNSLLSSLIKIDDLIAFALKNNIKSLSITDNNMYGAIEFYSKCIKNNIKPIIGLEVLLNNNKIVLYCMNYNGYKNLIKISTILSENNLNLNVLKEYNNDLICIVPYDSLELYDELSNIYEVIFKGFRNEFEYKNIDNPIYINEICYLNYEDSSYIKYLYGIKETLIIENIPNIYQNNYLELEQNIKFDLTNNYKLTEICDLKMEYQKDLLPKFDCPNNLDSFSYLKTLCKEGLKKLFGEKVSKNYIDRLKYELDIINKMGFCDYFLIVWDYVKYSKENNILVGPGRGSAAGSLVSYVLNITTIDPIKYNLFFERFLNPERVTMPDIDIDFEYLSRDKVVNYCINKYGGKKVAPIITFGTLGAKQAIRDVARVKDIPLKMVDKLCSLIDSRLTLKENYNNQKIKDYISINDELKSLYKISTKLEGLKRHTSIHAAGIVMCNYNLDEIVPLDKSHDEFYTTGYSMEYLEELGLLKMDFLALKNLTLIKNILNEINIDFDNIPLNDSKALNIFKEAKTLGIFQFESDGMINFIRKFKPDNFNDVVLAIALYRPGPMESIDSFIKRKQGKEKIDYINDDLKSILSDTYGIIIYQEQIMQIASSLASYSLGEADILRRAMSKKKEDVLIKQKDKFINQAIKNGYSEEVSLKVYNLILKFASYGFNKAHSVSYAMIAYKMAYLKANYPNIFMKHLLTSNIGSELKLKDYIYEAKSLSINIEKPNINLSGKTFEINNNKLLFPLTSIKGIGVNGSEFILKEREKGKFLNIFDFIERCYNKNVNKKTIESLIYSGCFSEFGYNIRTLIENLEVLINYAEIGSFLSEQLRPIIEEKEEFSNKELISLELDVFGFYLSNHPVTEYKFKYKTPSLNELTFNKDTELYLLVDRIKEIDTKNNDKMCFITASDELSNIDLVIFPKVYSKVKDIKPFDIIHIYGKVERRFDKTQIIVNSIEKEN